MSREAYAPPTSNSNAIASPYSTSQYGNNSYGGQQGGAGSSSQGGQYYEPGSKPVSYQCGDCESKVSLRREDPVRCKECGHRVLYKMRTDRVIQFQAI